MKVNEAKSGTGRTWERKFLGFRLNRKLQIGIAPESIERFKAKVRELWRSRQSRTSNHLRDAWRSFIRGWWGYFQLAEDRQPIYRLEGWIRGTCGNTSGGGGITGRDACRKLRSLGVIERPRRVASSGGALYAKAVDQRGPSANRVLYAIRSCGDEPLSSTAGCGKPHVRWCGSVTAA